MPNPSHTVFVSGRYDLVHAGHLQFFREARALGGRLVVCFASERVAWLQKDRRSSLPDEHKRRLLQSLRMVDEVVMGTGETPGLDFEEPFLLARPHILAVTVDDQYADLKRQLCRRVGAEYVVLPKTPPECEPISTRERVKTMQAPEEVPLRVDFAGGWLDVPRLARPGAFVVNCAVSPLVSLQRWPYRRSTGLGGNAAWALLNGQASVGAELGLGMGWQDAAVIRETGLCVWRSGPSPALEFKRSGDFLSGRMALLWTDPQPGSPGLASSGRDYALIQQAGERAAQAVATGSLTGLAEAMDLSLAAQVREGMPALPEIPHALARKYCGGGWGGYALCLFANSTHRDAALVDPRMTAIEPYLDSRSD